MSFDVPLGSIFGLLGPNGAGKTTLFSLAAGFINADEGNIGVLDTDVAHISDLQGRLTILPQDAAFQKNVPIIEQLLFFRLLDGRDRKTAEREVEEALENVGIAEYKHRGIHALSHGMLKRMGIAQAFLGEPELILLDEPTSGLDPQNARQIRDLIRTMQQERGVTTVISSHNLGEIQELCDHVAILDKGRLKTAGSVEAVTRGGRMLEVELRRPLTDAERARLLTVAGIGNIADRGPQRYRFEFALDEAVSVDAVTIAKLTEAAQVIYQQAAEQAQAEGEAEAGAAADIFEWNAEETKRIYGQTVESRFEDTRVHVYYQPVGVVAALSPWNFPLVLSARKISTALAAGCSVIIKPDVITPG
ncbi:MAG TPA: aldehyde dehydrogenase family protein, partial [Planctomycetes bacterium]|nr:aldehyde dehydrogenase family protein [Planctomycetota bacterium]